MTDNGTYPQADNSEQCPYCMAVFYAMAGYDPLHHHFEYCPSYPDEQE
jgi:hypothetical protein